MLFYLLTLGLGINRTWTNRQIFIYLDSENFLLFQVAVIKKNIRKFNGFDFDKDDKRFEKKRAQLSK